AACTEDYVLLEGKIPRTPCWDNTVVERFFGSLKHDWLLKVHQPTRAHMKQDVAAYMKYYNLDRLHSSKGDLSPVEYEKLAN
ncbi:integrase core domain-containing protein, partial [Alteromonas sp. CH_XMU1407-6]